MKTLADIWDALGPPQIFRELRNECGVQAAVARWKHAGASVNLRGADSWQLIFNISGGQVVESCSGGCSSRRLIQAGSVVLVRPGDLEEVRITGRADTLQFLMRKEFLASLNGSGPSISRQLVGNSRFVQAAAVRALVCLAQDRRHSAAELDSILIGLACKLARPALADSRPSCGGLSTGAKRRVRQLIADPTQHRLKVSELAAAAGLSVHHFIKAFRQSEGETPHARVKACRIEKALALLLQTDRSVVQIARETGFCSSSHFVSAFGMRFGVTPRAFRHAVCVRL